MPTLEVNFSVHPNNFSAMMLFGLSLSNYVLMYGANIYLARHLNIDAFDDYSVAISIVTLLSVLATLGLEKYALHLIALYIERKNWAYLRGFLRFSLCTILLFSALLMGVLSIGLETFLSWQNADYHISIVIYIGFLPVIALCLFFIEVVSVYGLQILALALYRLFLPAVFLLLIIGLKHFQLEVTATSVVLCFGTAWCLTLILLLFTVWTASPKELKQIKPNSKDRYGWLRKSLPLLISSLMMTLLTSSGVIILEVLYPSQDMVGTYAVAIQTTSFIALIGTSTNRYYLPMLMVLVDRHDHYSTEALLRKRMWLIVCFIVIFLGIIGTWGQEILGLFGSNFSQEYPVLCICAVGASFMTLFSDAPYYLQFMGRNRLVVSLMALAVTIMISLSFILGSRYGSIGVAVAYTVPAILLFTSLKLFANRHRHKHELLTINVYQDSQSKPLMKVDDIEALLTGE